MTEGKKRTAAKPRKAKAVPAVPHEATAREIEQREALRARNMERSDRPEVKHTDSNGTRALEVADDQDPKFFQVAMLEAFGTRSLPFLNDTMDNISRGISKHNNLTITQQNAALAIMAAVEPENELEATLAAQMVLANDAANRCLRAMVGAEWVPQHQMYGNLANKFMRTFGAHVETLAKLRRKGEQVVKHIHVHEGAQAVIDSTINQQQGGALNAKGDERPHEATGTRVSSERATLPCPDAATLGMPLASNAEREVLPAWREVSGAAAGQPERL